MAAWNDHGLWRFVYAGLVLRCFPPRAASMLPVVEQATGWRDPIPMRTILDPLYHCIEQHPERLLYAFLDRHGNTAESYTYAEFLRRTTDIAAHIQSAARLEPGERCLLYTSPSPRDRG